jgi:hypothetical protein
MRKLILLLLGISIAACHSKKNITEQPVANSNHPAKFNSSVTIDNPDDIKPLLVDAPQIFTVPAKTIKKIEAKKGLRVTVNTNNLETTDGQDVSGDIQVSIKEMSKASDMIANNCPTVADGKMLVSDGAYYVGMTCNGKQLQIKKGKSLQMEFPRFSEDGMELFYGERNNDGTMNWKPLNKKLETTNDKIAANNIADNVRSTIINSNNDNYWSQDLSFDKRLQLYEDSVKETRRAYIVCHYKNMTQDDIRKVMLAPYKMAVKDLPLYGMRYWRNFSQNISICNNSYADYFVEPIKGVDSVLYFIDIAFSFNGNQPSTNTAVDDLNRIDEVSTEKSVTKKTKKGIKITIPGKVTVSAQYYDPVEITDLGWLNCDHFYNSPEGVAPLYTLYIKDSIPANIGVYMIFRDINSMLQQKINTGGKNMITINQPLPLNSTVEFLIYSKRNNKFIQYKETATITKNMVLPVAFTPVPDEQVRKYFLN